jgi:hypothetical protein
VALNLGEPGTFVAPALFPGLGDGPPAGGKIVIGEKPFPVALNYGDGAFIEPRGHLLDSVCPLVAKSS